jgi:FkbM family methyltransferase
MRLFDHLRVSRFLRQLGLRQTCNLLYGRWFRAKMPTVMSIRGASLSLRPCSSDFLVFTQIFVDRMYDISELPGNPSVIVDCGANVGFASVFFALRYPHARILAIEPEASNFEASCANLRAFPQVIPIRAAIWPQDEGLEIADSAADHWGFQVRPSRDGDAGLRGVSLGSLLEEHGIGHVDILKIDIEGAEKELFSADDIEWINHVGTLTVELHEDTAPGAKAAFLKTIGRRPHRHYRHLENEVVVFNG